MISHRALVDAGEGRERAVGVKSVDTMSRKIRVGTPSEVIVVRSSDGGGNLGKPRVHHSRQPSVQGCRRMRVSHCRSAALAARVQASELFPKFRVSDGQSNVGESDIQAWNAFPYRICSESRKPMLYEESSKTSPFLSLESE